MDDEFNLRVHPPLLVLTSHTQCWKCQSAMPVVALGAYVLEEDGEFIIESNDHSDMAILSNVGSMADWVLAAMRRSNPNYSKRYSRMAGGKYFANTCPACGVLTGDFYLHAEPGGAFFPTTDEEAAAITVEELVHTQPIRIEASWGAGTGDFILAHAVLK